MPKKVPYVAQLGTMDCGIACLTMIFRYYGRKVDIVDVGSNIPIGRDGISIATMRDIAEKHGFKLVAYNHDYSEEEIERRLPAILYSGTHFVVAEKHYNRYIILDPAKGKKQVTFAELKKGYPNIYLFVKPEREINEDSKFRWDITFSKCKLLEATVLMLCTQGLTLCVPFIIKKVVDDITSAERISSITWCITIVAVLVVYYVVSRIRQTVLLKIDVAMFRQIANKLLNKLFGMDASFFEWHSAGDIANRFSNINQLNDLITNGLVNIVIQSATSAVCFLTMLFISKELAAVSLGLAIIEIALLVYLNKKNKDASNRYARSQSVLQSDLVDSLSNMLEIKCMGLETIIEEHLTGIYEKHIDDFESRARSNNLLDSISMVFSLAIPLFMYCLGSELVYNKAMTFGSLSAYATLAGYFIAPFTTAVYLLPRINAIKELAIRYKEIMCCKSSNLQKEVEEQNRRQFEELCVNNVSFSYNPSNSVDNLSDVSLTIHKGDFVAIVGRSGSGKSTLAKAMLGVVHPKSGEITVNGRSVEIIAEKQLREWFSIVTQNPMCLNDTVRRNVDFAGKYSDAAIWEALSVAEVKNDIKDMPLQLDTMIGESGQNISGGQRQRLAIARAVLTKADALILDEATSNLDPNTEQKIFGNLLSRKMTMIVITHRLSTIKNADNIIVIKNGKVIEKGNHDQLVKNGGWYATNILYNENVDDH